MAALETTGGSPTVAPNRVSPQEAARLRKMVDEEFALVFRVLCAFGMRPADAEDGAQMVFIIAARKLSMIVAGSERAFLCATARGVAANARRSNTRNREDTGVDIELAVDGTRGPEEAAERSEAKRHLLRIMDGMDDDAREVFTLYELEGVTTLEIARIVGAPQGTVASRLRRAREHFESESTLLEREIYEPRES